MNLRPVGIGVCFARCENRLDIRDRERARRRHEHEVNDLTRARSDFELIPRAHLGSAGRLVACREITMNDALMKRILGTVLAAR